MKHVIRKIFWNYEQEEKWLNRLAAKGLALTDYSWCRYALEETPPGEYLYRIEMLDQDATHPESRQYIAFVEETGAECVSTYMRWAYFRKKAVNGPFELFSDNTSRIAHVRRIQAFWLGITIMDFFAFAINLVAGLVLPTHALNLTCAGILAAILILFAFMYGKVTRRVQRLRREQKIIEG